MISQCIYNKQQQQQQRNDVFDSAIIPLNTSCFLVFVFVFVFVHIFITLFRSVDVVVVVVDVKSAVSGFFSMWCGCCWIIFPFRCCCCFLKSSTFDFFRLHESERRNETFLPIQSICLLYKFYICKSLTLYVNMCVLCAYVVMRHENSS